MFKLLTKIFIRDYKNTENEIVRRRYGFFAGIVGIVTNFILVLLKALIGFLSMSISIIADALNNFSDAISNLVTIIAFKLSGKEPDEKHPFGHERIEYIGGLIVSFLILLLGFNFLISSVERIFKPELTKVTEFTVIILIISIIIKLWQMLFYRYVHKKINSPVIEGAKQDSRNDVLITLTVLISSLVALIFNVDIDGYIATFVSIIIIVSGIKIFLQSSSPLIGLLPDKEVVDKMLEILLEDKKVRGYHDLMIHSYGPNKYYASIHLEFDYKEDILETHELIDKLEKDVFQLLNIELVVHLDPIIFDDNEINELNSIVKNILKEIDESLSFHDLRIVRGLKNTNVLFDIEIPILLKISKDNIKEILEQKLKEYNEKYTLIVIFDRKIEYK